jgi:hypothetical protein
MVEHPFRAIKRHFGFRTTLLPGLVEIRCKVKGLAVAAR